MAPFYRIGCRRGSEESQCAITAGGHRDSMVRLATSDTQLTLYKFWPNNQLRTVVGVIVASGGRAVRARARAARAWVSGVRAGARAGAQAGLRRPLGGRPGGWVGGRLAGGRAGGGGSRLEAPGSKRWRDGGKDPLAAALLWHPQCCADIPAAARSVKTV